MFTSEIIERIDMSISLSAIAIRQLIQLRRRRGLGSIVPRTLSSSSSRNLQNAIQITTKETAMMA